MRQCLQWAACTHPHKSTHPHHPLSPPPAHHHPHPPSHHLSSPKPFLLSGGQLLVGGSTLRGFALIATETEALPLEGGCG